MTVCQDCIRATDHLIKCIEFNVSFLLLDNCPSGTIISFIDKEPNTSGVFPATGEGELVWINNNFSAKLLARTNNNNPYVIEYDSGTLGRVSGVSVYNDKGERAKWSEE